MNAPAAVVIAIVGLLVLANPTPADDLALWDFNYDLGQVDEMGFSNVNGYSPPPVEGSGTALLIGGVEPRFEGGDYALGFNDGWHGDPHGGEGEEGNYGWQTFEYPEQGTGDGTAGVQFNVSTEDFSEITISYAHRFSGRSSRHAALEYTLDGGFTWTRAYEYEAVNGHNEWYFQSLDLNNIPGASDNPDFGFRVVAIFMPGSDVPGYEDANDNRPGVLWDDEGYRPSGTWRFDMVTVASNTVPIYINEIMASNFETIADEDGDFEDWIELYNAGDESIDLGGYGLSDDYDNPFRWVMPSVTIEPGGFLLVWASGKDRDGPELHTNFAISSSGEEVLLTAPDGTRIDEIAPVPIPTDVSYGRFPDGSPNLVYFEVPTPGAPNSDETAQGKTDAPTFSVEGGFYTKEFLLELSADAPESIIYYTLDGSTPNEESTVYTRPILIEDRTGEPNVLSLIPTNMITGNLNAWMPPNEVVFKVTPVRAMVVKPDALPSDVVTHTYLVAPDIFDRYELAVFSINTDPKNFFDDEIGIYVPGDKYVEGDDDTGNYFERGIEWERPVHVEFFETDGTRVLGQDAGVRIHGGWTRRWAQKSLRLYARNSYSTNSFDYQFFTDLEDSSFRRLLLRNSGNDWRVTSIRDAMMQTLARDIGVDTQAYRPTIVFLNGEFWGLHNLRERYDRHYLARVHGVDPDNVQILTANAEVKEGNADHYNAMLDYIADNDMSDPVHYEYVKTQMDVENFISYYAFQIYIANTDWPQNNIDFWRTDTPDGRWQWLMFDTDLGFWLFSANNAQHESLQRLVLGNPNWWRFLFQSLLDNESFQSEFINRYADFINTIFVPEDVLDLVDSTKSTIDLSMHEVIPRWPNFQSLAQWTSRFNRIYDFAVDRPWYARLHVVETFNLPGQADLTFINPTLEKGSIRVNTVDLDEYGSPWSGIYFQTIPLPLYAEPKEGYHFVKWEGIPESKGQEVFLYTPSGDSTLTAVFARGNGPGAPIPGDLNGDGSVNVNDLLILLSDWGACANCNACPADLNGDCSVNIADLLILLGNWG